MDDEAPDDREGSAGQIGYFIGPHVAPRPQIAHLLVYCTFSLNGGKTLALSILSCIFRQEMQQWCDASFPFSLLFVFYKLPSGPSLICFHSPFPALNLSASLSGPEQMSHNIWVTEPHQTQPQSTTVQDTPALRYTMGSATVSFMSHSTQSLNKTTVSPWGQ